MRSTSCSKDSSRLPAEPLACLAGIADAGCALGGTHTGLVHAQVALGVEIDAGEGGLGELGDGVRHAAGEHVVAGLLLLEHQPGAAHDVTGEGPVAHGVERAELELVLATERDRGGGARDRRVTKRSGRRSDSWL